MTEERERVLAKIAELEKQGIFDKDVEDDPPSKVIQPGTVDYCQKKLSTRIKAKYAFHLGRKFLNNLVKHNQIVIKEIIGIENMNSLDSGAILTCNHFSPMDSFATQMVYEKSVWRRKRKLFRIIKEGNYTSFPGFYGKLMRNCNTLPLSSNVRTLMEFMKGVDYHLKNGNYVLIYPEQSLWWNYRKPKPLKPGAFNLAVRSNVPVIPIFICMEDTDQMDSDGYPVQAYTIYVGKPIFEDENLSASENRQKMADENYAFWKQTYEDFYHKPLVYTCDE